MYETLEGAEPMYPVEEYRVAGDRLFGRVRELIHEGNVRRIIVKNNDGHTIMELPFTAGIVGGVFLPIGVALGAIAALAASYTLLVEKEVEAEAMATRL